MPNAIRFFHALAALLLLLGFLAAPLSIGAQAAARHASDQTETVHLTSDQAIAVALNDLQATAGGYRLRHPRYVATFTPDGLQFTPRRGGPAWSWQLAAVAGESPLSEVNIGAVRPTHETPGVIAYARGGLVEQYLARGNSIEQRFVLPRRPSVGVADLVIVGLVRSVGTFEVTEDGWRWRTSDGAVCLGNVRVYDAAGRDLPAAMQVTATQTRIVVEGNALTHAAYPVTIDPEIGANDFRLSDMGGDDAFDASAPAVAYNSTNHEYLVVWQGDDDTGGLVDGEFEIYGQRVDAATGAEIGTDVRLSDMGPDGDPNYGAFSPAVAYNSANDEYLVVWHGDDDAGGLADDEFEVYGQRVDAATGAEIGTDVRLSDMGPDGNASYGARYPAVAYDSTDNVYLVVWQGDDDTPPLADNEYEIYGQRVNAGTGAEIGTDTRLSDMGPDGDTGYNAFSPAVAYNSTNHEYLVVWHGDDDTGGLVGGELEIFGQRVFAGTGAEIGTDSRLSDMGPDGNVFYDAASPAVAYNSVNNEYLVVWYGDDDTGGSVDNEFEIYGQRVNAATGAEIGTDSRLSDMGPDGNIGYVAFYPAVAYNSVNNQYLVVWQGKDTGGPTDDGLEVYGQRVNAATGAETGTNDARLSDMGPNGSVSYKADDPAVAYGSTGNGYLVVWQGDDDTPPLVNDEFEIFGQRVNGSGTEVGANDFRLSDMGGDDAFSASDPAVAYNSTNHEYLVVWSGDDNTGALVDGEFEIYGQRVDAATGVEIGADVRLSDMGPDGDASYGAFYPAVVYNSANNEYLVVWQGNDLPPYAVAPGYEIYGQRVNAATGAEIGTDLRLSDMGPDGNVNYGAHTPAVAYDSTDNVYLVVWLGDDDTPPLVNDEYEIFGQRVNAATGTEIGTDLRLSDMGPNGNVSYGAFSPAVAYNSTNHEYLVVWSGDDDTPPVVDGEYEIYGQRVDAATGAEIGSDLRLSDMGPDGSLFYEAVSPAVAYSSASNEYLVVWHGDDDTPPVVNGEYEVYGQRVNAATGAEIGTDSRLSDMGPDGDVNYGAFSPAVAYSIIGPEYLVVWYGDDDASRGEAEIYGQRVNAATGAEIGGDLRLSDMGPDGSVSYDAYTPAVAYNSANNEYLVVWSGDDDIPPLVDGEYEIFGQRFAVVANLSVTKSDTPDPVVLSATLTYTLAVDNAGPDVASSVTVVDDLPSGVTFVSASGTGWACGHAGGVVTCTTNSLAVGPAPSLVVVVTAPTSGGTITNTATVTSGTQDPNAADNTATITTLVQSSVEYELYLPLVLRQFP